jgi:hypothetical protein
MAANSGAGVAASRMDVSHAPGTGFERAQKRIVLCYLHNIIIWFTLDVLAHRVGIG